MKKLFLGFLAVLGACLILVRPVSAVTITEHTVELNAQPGDTFERSMQLYDDSGQGAVVYPSIYNFKEDPAREGIALVVTDPNEFKADREWVKVPSDAITLPKEGTLVPFSYKIEVPADADPGTHLLSIVFSTKPPEAGSNGTSVSIGTNVVTNIFLKIAGATVDSIEADFAVGRYTNTDESASLIERQKTFQRKTFFFKPPVDFLISVHNTGNTHQKPDGNIRVTNDFFGKTYEKITVNSGRKIVLPGGTRGVEVDSFGKGIMLGKYRAKLTLIYGNPLREYTKEVDFWIVPVVEIAIGLGILILIIVLIHLLRRAAKKRRERQEKKKEEELRKTLREEIQNTMRDESGKEASKTAEPAEPQVPKPPVIPPPAPPTPSV
jgi:hypothetical protein